MRILLAPVFIVLAFAIPAPAQTAGAVTGVLLLAHGGQPQWNERVAEVVKRVNEVHPAEVAFGMATRANIQAAVDKLTSRGATDIIAVPLFVSSHSSVITATEYLLGLRADAPADLAKFAKMSHGSNGGGGDHAAHAADPASPVKTAAHIRMTRAFDRHPIIGAIVADRARAISQAPANEAVILVAHGPVPDDDNRRWLADIAVLAEQVRQAAPFASVDYMTVRDDAGPAIREAATKELRQKVEAQRALGRRVLIVPHLMSFGGIEQGLRKRLEGLEYTMAAQGLMPDDRIVQWVLTSAMYPGGLTEAVEVVGQQLIGSEEMLRRTPGSYDILTRAALEGARVFTSSEALRKIPGVSVRDEEGLGLRPNIGIRGLNPTRSSKVLLLEDGLPVTYAPYGDNASYYHPPIERFDRIEVLKGSSQIAYGPVTLGGVVNYITPDAPRRSALSLDLTAGSRDYVNGGVGAGGRRGNFGFFGHMVHKQADGSRDNIASTIDDVLGKTTWTFRDTRHLTVKGNYYREDSQVTYSGLREAEYQANPRQNPFANDRFDGRRFGASATYQVLLWSRVAATVQGYGSTFSRDWWRQSSNSGQRPNDSGDPQCGGMANLNTVCGNEGKLRDYAHGGVEARGRAMFGGALPQELDFGIRMHVEHQDRRQENGAAPTARAGVLVEDNERTTDGLSAFVQHRMMSGRWTITPGVRVERIGYSRTNRLAAVSGTTELTEVVPGIGASFGPSADVTVFGGLHRGFAPPRAEDVINNTTGGVIELDPERSWNYEGGVRGRLGAVQGSLTAFRLDYSNQIVPASVAGGVGATLTNGGETLHQGVEAGAHADWRDLGGSRHGLYTSAAVTWLPIARFEGIRTSSITGLTNVSVSGNRLPYAPELVQTFTLGYRHAAGIDLQVESQNVGAQFGDDLNTVTPTADGQRGRIEAYTYWNLTAAAPIGRTAGRIFVAVKNLTNRTFIIDRVRGILPGHPRLIHVGTSWRF